MKRLVYIVFALVAYTLSAKAAKIYINPGHGSYTTSCRPMATIPYPNMPDTLGFYESNTNLWKCLVMRDKLQAAGHEVMMSREASGGSDNGEYNKALSTIAQEVETFGADYFISVHSNADTDGAVTNFPLYFYRGYTGSPSVTNSDNMASTAHPYLNDIFVSGMEPISDNSQRIVGDITFHGTSSTSNGYTGYYGVLRHGSPGYLIEGYFHTYQPARHRALNPDWCRQEGIRHYRGIQAWYGNPNKETKGYIMGYVRTKEQEINQTYYTGRSGNDIYMPINGAKVVLRNSAGEIVKTDCYHHVARMLTNQDYYTTDNNYNGVFVFEDLNPGTYTISVHASGYQDYTETITVTADETAYTQIFLTSGTGTEPDITEPDIKWELNGGLVPGSDVPTNEELWEEFMNYFNTYYPTNSEEAATLTLGFPRPLQSINDVAVFWPSSVDSKANILTNENSRYKWLGNFIQEVSTAQGKVIETETFWRWNTWAFFNDTVRSSTWPQTADFTEAGKPEAWGEAYLIGTGSSATLPSSVSSTYTLPTPVREGYSFVGWYNNAEGTGTALAVLPAGWQGTLYAIWQATTTSTDNKCGDNLYWTLIDGTLTITGSGEMYDYDSNSAPWYNERSSIAAISLPQGLTRIGDFAFEYCSSLTSITIPNSVTSIGYLAFEYCSSLTSITIPNSVTNIGNYAFLYCSGLTSIVVNDENTKYDNRENCNAIIETATNTLIAGCQNTIIPNSVTSIGNWAFTSCYGLTSITIPNSVTSIGENAFVYCSGLTSVTIPNSVTSIGYLAFYGCSGLTSVYLEAPTPPALDSDVFTSSPTCYIPCGSLATYQASSWANQVGSFVDDCTANTPASNTHDFENANLNGQWQFVQSDQTNYWMIGSDAGSTPSGSNALYITNGSGYNYSNTSSGTTCVSWAYIPVSLTAADEISYDWKGTGEGSYDNLQVYLAPQSNLPTAGNTTVPSGTIQLGSNHNGVSDWTKATHTPGVSGNYNLCFMWRSDHSNIGTPAAIDNLIIGSSSPTNPSSHISYELNGGVTNDYGWQNKNDMFQVCMEDCGVTGLASLDEIKALADPYTAICGKLTDVSGMLNSSKWDWLEAYIMSVQNADATAIALVEGTTSAAWRYAVAAFFLESKRSSWPVSADFSLAGLIEAYQPAWKHGFDNPTETTAEFVLNTPYKEGSTFAGWYATADFSGNKITTITAETTGTLYAKWVEYIPTIAEVKALADDAETKVAGVVNFISGRNVYIQDATGGVLVYTAEEPTFQVGEKIVAKGVKVMYGGAPEVNSAVVESAEPGELFPATVFENLALLVADSLEHKYYATNVAVAGLSIVSYDSYNNPTVKDAVGNTAVCHRMSLDPEAFPLGAKISITAVAGWYNAFEFVGDVAGIVRPVVGVKEDYTYPTRYEKYTLENNWVISNVEDNYAANKPGSNDYVRGMAVKDGKMYFINRETQSITVIDGETGQMLDPIILQGTDTLFKTQQEDGTWADDTTLPYNDIKFDQAGNCLIGCCITGATKCQTFYIYVVDLETGVCTKLIEDVLWENPGLDQVQFRFDAFGVAGNVLENGVIMAADANGSWNVYRWLITDGVAGEGEQVAVHIDPATNQSLFVNAAGYGTAPQIVPQDEEGTLFYVDGYNTLPMLFYGTPEEGATLVDDFINVPTGLQVWNNPGDTITMDNSYSFNGLVEFQVGEEYFLLMVATRTVHDVPTTYALYKFANAERAFSGMEPLWYFPHNGLGTTTIAGRTAPVAVEVVDNTAYLYLYATNNGYARYELNINNSGTPSLEPEYVTICYGETYTWNGTNYSTSGTYTATTTNGEATLYLTVLPEPIVETENLTIQESQLPYTWRNQQITAAGSYTATAPYTNYDCDSAIYTLNLTVNPATASYIHDFEDATLNAQWQFIQENQTNYWRIGTGAGSIASNQQASVGYNALYITNNAQDYTYNKSSASVSWAYLPVSLLATDTLSFDWMGVGEGSYDYMCVYLAPLGSLPAAGSTTAPSGAIAVGSRFNAQATWQHFSDVPALEGDYNLFFMWRNDGSASNGAPAAIDNVTIKSTSQQQITYTITDLQVTTDCGTATASWESEAPYFEVTVFNANNDTVVHGIIDFKANVSNTTPLFNGNYTWRVQPMHSNTAGDYAGNSVETYFTINLSYCNQEWTFDDNYTNKQWKAAHANQTNYWMFGTTAGSTNGDYALHITNDGTNYAYTNNVSSISWAYVPVALLETDTISFDWKGYGEGSYDYMHAYLAPIASLPASGNMTLPEGSIQLGSRFNNSDTWTNFSTISGVEGEYNLLFLWVNDGSSGSTPIAIDNVRISKSTGSAPPTSTENKCGDYLYWTYADGTLTITGSGAMYDDHERLSYRQQSWFPHELYRVNLSTGMTRIGDNAFADCINLSSITIPSAVTAIGANAFAWSGIKSINIPANVTSIGANAFAKCGQMTKFIYRGDESANIDNANIPIFIGCNLLDTVVAPAQIWDCTTPDTEIEDHYGLPSNISYIEVTDGYLTTAAINYIAKSKQTIQTLDITNTTNTSLPQNAFKSFNAMTTLLLPSNLGTIPYQMAAYSKNLKHLSIPTSVRTIGTGAFQGCSQLFFIDFAWTSQSLTEIGASAFAGCTSMLEVVIPEGVTYIGAEAFKNCTSLLLLKLPSTLQTIANEGFYGCTRLTKMRVKAYTPPSAYANAFDHVSRSIPVYVPESVVTSYQNTSVWQEFFIQSDVLDNLENVTTNDHDTVQKIFHNGQVLIIRNGKCYDLMGQTVTL